MTGFRDQDVQKKHSRGHFWLTSRVHSVPGIRYYLSLTMASQRRSGGGALASILGAKRISSHMLDAQISAKEVGSTKGTGREHLGEGRKMQEHRVQGGDAGRLGLADTA